MKESLTDPFHDKNVAIMTNERYAVAKLWNSSFIYKQTSKRDIYEPGCLSSLSKLVDHVFASSLNVLTENRNTYNKLEQNVRSTNIS